jgi:hypothetical protein
MRGAEYLTGHNEIKSGDSIDGYHGDPMHGDNLSKRGTPSTVRTGSDSSTIEARCRPFHSQCRSHVQAGARMIANGEGARHA